MPCYVRVQKAGLNYPCLIEKDILPISSFDVNVVQSAVSANTMLSTKLFPELLSDYSKGDVESDQLTYSRVPSPWSRQHASYPNWPAPLTLVAALSSLDGDDFARHTCPGVVLKRVRDQRAYHCDHFATHEQSRRLLQKIKDACLSVSHLSSASNAPFVDVQACNCRSIQSATQPEALRHSRYD